MSNVRIESSAFGDERYQDLADFAGLADADHARGKMARLWRQCTLERRYQLVSETITRVLGPNGVDAIVRARLGTLMPDGTVRIHGTKGRIEWLEKLKQNGKKGGRPKGYRNKPSGSADGTPLGSADSNPITSLLSSSQGSEKRKADSPFPEAFSATPDLERIASERGLDLTTEIARMRDWAAASGARKKDWQAFARNWLRNQRQAQPPRGLFGSQPAHEPVRQIRTLKP